LRAALSEEQLGIHNGAERGRGGSRSVFISAARRLDRRRFYDAAGNVVETHEHTGDFKEW